MFDENPEVAAQVDAVYRELEKLDRGDVFTHKRIGKLIGLRPHEENYDHIVHRALARLEKQRGIAYWAVIGVGYELLTAARTLEVIPVKRAAKAYRQYRRLHRSVGRLPQEGLSQQERLLRTFVLDQAAQQKKALRRDQRTLARLFQPTETVPRRPAPEAVGN